jgi:hypothetical protein
MLFILQHNITFHKSLQVATNNDLRIQQTLQICVCTLQLTMIFQNKLVSDSIAICKK